MGPARDCSTSWGLDVSEGNRRAIGETVARRACGSWSQKGPSGRKSGRGLRLLIVLPAKDLTVLKGVFSWRSSRWQYWLLATLDVALHTASSQCTRSGSASPPRRTELLLTASCGVAAAQPVDGAVVRPGPASLRGMRASPSGPVTVRGGFRATPSGLGHRGGRARMRTASRSVVSRNRLDAYRVGRRRDRVPAQRHSRTELGETKPHDGVVGRRCPRAVEP